MHSAVSLEPDTRFDDGERSKPPVKRQWEFRKSLFDSWLCGKGVLCQLLGLDVLRLNPISRWEP